MNPQLSSWLPTIVAVPLVGFMLYRRLRRTFGRQLFTPKRMVLRMVLLGVLGTTSPITEACSARRER